MANNEIGHRRNPQARKGNAALRPLLLSTSCANGDIADAIRR